MNFCVVLIALISGLCIENAASNTIVHTGWFYFYSKNNWFIKSLPIYTVVAAYKESVTLNCTSATWEVYNSSTNGTTPITNGGKYNISGNSLTISDLSKNSLNCD